MSNYFKADTTTQWFQDDYPGADMNLSEATEVVVLHTTESTGWPGYDGGAKAPHYTAMPDIANRKILWRGHFPDEKSSRALRNEAGGVETNTLNCVQVELIGTCDPKHEFTWGTKKAGVDYIFWPKAPYWALRAVAQFLVDQHDRHGLQLRSGLVFKPYPASYGDNGVRLSFSEWRNFVGILGHQHVPENSHGDPGDLKIATILNIAKEILDARLTQRPTLRTVTANLHHGNPRIDAALKVLVAQDGDVYFLNETKGFHAKIKAALGKTHVKIGGEGGSIGHREVQLWIRKGIKIHDTGIFQATEDLHEGFAPDRWVAWATVTWAGKKLLLISWHGNAAIQTHKGVMLWIPRTREYKREMIKLGNFMRDQKAKGFHPIIGGDTNYHRPIVGNLWYYSPERLFGRQGLEHRSLYVDKIAWPKFLDESGHYTVKAPGCDHRWLIVDLEKS